jgi:hypothetical protein
MFTAAAACRALERTWVSCMYSGICRRNARNCATSTSGVRGSTTFTVMVSMVSFLFELVNGTATRRQFEVDRNPEPWVLGGLPGAAGGAQLDSTSRGMPWHKHLSALRLPEGGLLLPPALNAPESDPMAQGSPLR